MKSKKIFAITAFIAICIGLFVIPVQAREQSGIPGNRVDQKLTGSLAISVQVANGISAPTTILVYDSQGNTVKSVSTQDSGYRFTGMQAGAYQVVAYVEDMPLEASKEAVVETAKTESVALDLHRAVAPAGKNKVARSCSGSVSGDGNLLKIYSGFGPAVVYMQCGRVVASYGAGSSCSCNNKFAYTYDCEKVAPVVVNIPCGIKIKKFR